jgi:hypothetical protein
MASHTMQAVYLLCDGCGKALGEDGRFRSAVEARAGAYAEGWRYPPSITPRGKPGNRTHDVCAECISEWVPREYVAHGQYRLPDRA